MHSIDSKIPGFNFLSFVLNLNAVIKKNFIDAVTNMSFSLTFTHVSVNAKWYYTYLESQIPNILS